MTRHDLLELEQRLRACVYKILPFEAHALYFPQTPQSAEPVWIPEENRLLLPLRQTCTGTEGEDDLLGVFMARGVNAARVEALMPELPALAELCLDNLELFKAGRLDATTGLFTRQVFLEQVREAVARIVAPFGDDEDKGPDSGREAYFALAVIRFPALDGLARQWGHAFAEKVLVRLAEVFRESLPAELAAVTARVGDNAFAVLFPGGNSHTCSETLAETLHKLEGVVTPLPHTGRGMAVRPCAGFALYPRDMDGAHADLGDPAPALLHKAGLAADVAASREGEPGVSRLMAYGRILYEGGSIRRVLPLSRVEISLGRGEGAREGQCFSVWSVDYPVQTGAGDSDRPRQPLYKGEIVILESREGESVSEILHLGDPSWPMQPGDTLALLPHSAAAAKGTANPAFAGGEAVEPPLDALTGLFRHGDFLTRLAKARDGVSQFVLAMVHLTVPSDDAYRMAQVARECRETFAAAGLNTGDEVLGGRFATSTLVFYHPQGDVAALTASYAELAARLSAQHGPVAVGLSPWPFLSYHPGDALECCRKALEYAALLPEPHVGVFDSLALNISADKKHCRGDVFEAMEEYKLALLADADNALAWNSLGVCMAGLGRHDEARRHYEEALRRTPEDPALAYNIGVACQLAGDLTVAREHYENCLQRAPGHLFATLRLGQLDERRGDFAAARVHFEAAAAHSESALPHRSLARMALLENKPQAAREALHQALLHDPRDAESLALMARLYLDGGEDPELAETLARQSLALRPESKNGWRVLARALEARGLHKDARSALLKGDSL